MTVVEAILHLIDSLGNWFGLLINRITIFFNSVFEVISYIVSILQAIWYGLTSLLSGIWDLVVEVIRGGVFFNVGKAFSEIASYIGGPATVFLATLLFIIIFRIFIAFVFKIFRLNIDYHNTYNKQYTMNQHNKN